MADPRAQKRLHDYQISHPQVDLSAGRQNAHALYWYNLQVCFANEVRWREIRHDKQLEAVGVANALRRVLE